MSQLADLERKYIAALGQIETLTAERDALRAQLERLTETPPVPMILRLTKTETAIFAALLGAQVPLSKERLFAAGWSSKLGMADEPEIKIVDVILHRLRKKLEPFGLSIATVPGQGYVATRATKDAAQRMNREAAAA